MWNFAARRAAGDFVLFWLAQCTSVMTLCLLTGFVVWSDPSIWPPSSKALGYGAITGILHDFDYEKHPTMEEHPFVGVSHLRERGDVDEGIIEAILGHALYSGVERTTLMAKYLFACDELSGLIVACCKVRPDGVESLQPKSVKKKLKDKAFAAGVDRDDVARGVELLGIERAEHIQNVIDGMRKISDVLEIRAEDKS